MPHAKDLCSWSAQGSVCSEVRDQTEISGHKDPQHLPEESFCCWVALISLCSPLTYSMTQLWVSQRRTLIANIFCAIKFCAPDLMGHRIQSNSSSTSFPQCELHLSSLHHCPALPVTMSLGDSSRGGFTYIFDICCCGLAGCHEGYFDVMFQCPICSPSPASSSYINTMELFPGKGCQIENSEYNEAGTHSPTSSASPMKAAHTALPWLWGRHHVLPLRRDRLLRQISISHYTHTWHYQQLMNFILVLSPNPRD